MVSPLIAQKNQRLHVDIAPAQWYGDPARLARLAQIVSNLLTNASRYSQPEADIVVRTAVTGGELEIEVADNGTGLSADCCRESSSPSRRVSARCMVPSAASGSALRW
jgi:signal transduction histidine kinase